MWKKKMAHGLIAALFVSAISDHAAFAAGWVRSEYPSQESGLSSGWWYSANQENTQWYASKEETGVSWYWIDGNRDGIAECYAFNHDGWMYADTMTPDGYQVDKNGAWILDGIVQTKKSSLYAGVKNGGSSGGGGGNSGGGGTSGDGGGNSGGGGTSGDGDGNSGGGGISGDGGSGGEITYPDEGEEKISYVIQCVDMEGKLLKQVAGIGKKGEYISLGIQIKGYELTSSQPISAQLQSDGDVFSVCYYKKAEVASPSDTEEIYSYTIQYVDIVSGNILAAETGKAELGSTVSIPHPDITGYEICESQMTEFLLSRDKMVQNVSYRFAVEDATPSDAKKVNWTVHFVDQEDHSRKLWATQSGSIVADGILTINFPETIYGANGEIWECVESPPIERQIFGPENHIEYVEFVNTGDIPLEPDPDENGKEQLNHYLEQAREYEAEITGEVPEKIPIDRFIIANQSENDYRVRSIATQVNDTREHTFYVIGKNFVPNGKTIAAWFGKDAVYGNLLEEVVVIGNDQYYVARMGIQRKFSAEDGRHMWRVETKQEATCLGKGKIVYMDDLTGQTEEVILPPMGHADQNNDSICDRCQKRAIPQTLGNQIQAVLGKEKLTFTCIDEDYDGGMLYLADQTVSLNFFDGYGHPEYAESNLYRYFRDGFLNGFSIKNGLVGVRVAGTNGVSYGMCLSKDEYETYRETISGKTRFLLRDNMNGQILGVDESGAYQLQNPDTTDYGVRIAVVLEKPETGTADRIHWNIGDVQARDIDGITYLFRCIDQNYSDVGENHRQTALFLSDSIIPANYGSDYKLKEMEDGSHQYVFVPGPLVNFGESNDYKYSKLREWLSQQTDGLFHIGSVPIGVDYAFMGKTEEQEFSSLDANHLKSYYIGNQRMNDKMFILSVDEALKYKDFLWKFDGADIDNPDSQYAAFSKGYWLRNPMGNQNEYDTGYAYVVDTVNGNIHPAAVKPNENTGNDELDVTTVYGIRPVFTMPQD